ncbi:glutamate mutase L [bacterium]|nr:glutamate mutase L [bacterium]MCB2179219.1 glutamate mutase L [bacterium]
MTKTKAFYDEPEDLEAPGDTQETKISEEQAAPATFRAGSLLTLDVGSVNTRVALFDIVEGRARFLAAGVAPTSANPPLLDVSEGIRVALEQVEAISGRYLTAENGLLMVPSTEDGHGADFLASTLSLGPPLKTVVVGLLDKVSLESVTHLANTSYTEVIAEIGLNNMQKPESYIDLIQKTRPDMILIAGGTDNGASKSVLRLINMVGMALFLLPEENRPKVLFAGNPALAKQIHRFIKPLASIQIAPNIRPSLTTERLEPAEPVLTETYRSIHLGRVSGLVEVNTASGNNMMQTSHALGRVIRFFSKIMPNSAKSGVLGIDVGASSTVLTGGFDGDLRLRVFTNLGMGTGLSGVLAGSKIEDVQQWIPGEVSSSYILDYIQNKILHPATLPMTQQDLYIEQALARVIISRAIHEGMNIFPKNANRLEQNTLPTFDPIVVSGGVITNAPSPAHSLLMILDGLQPTGIQRILLDSNHLTPGLGAASATAPELVSQLLLDPTVLLNLGFVISPIVKAKPGTAVLRVRVKDEKGYETTVNVHQGNIQTIPIAMGERAKVFLDPLHRANIGFGPGKSTTIQVVGGLFGLVIDARGRPLNIPSDPEARRSTLLKWQNSLSKKK